jgi:DNA polymerase
MKLYLDIETYWPGDLKKQGAVRCLSDEHAGINCIAYAIDDGPISLIPYDDCQKIDGFFGFVMLVDQATKSVSHNAAFEMEVLKRILKWKSEPSEWTDTMAKCLYYGYPAGLDDAAKALGCSKLKDIIGKGVMQKLVSGKYTPQDSPDDFNRLYSYCINDVAVMREIDQKLPDLPPDVQRSWEVDAEINALGVPVDLCGIQNAIELKREIEAQNDRRIQYLTEGYVTTVNQTAKIVEWFNSRNALQLSDCTADSIAKMLNVLPPSVARQVLELRQETGLTSLAKYQKMADYQVNHRLYGMHFWYGAHTGRPTGSGPQILNLPRSENSDFYAHCLNPYPASYLHADKPAEKLKGALRGMICAPPGKMLVGVDLAQIEARATGWVAGEQKFLDLFATTDPYCTYGKSIFGREITKNDVMERTASKATVLAFGFAGGIGAGQRVAENYKINFSALADLVLSNATELEIGDAERNYKYYIDKKPLKPLSQREGFAVDILKQRYRRDFPLITAYWDTLEQAFIHGGSAGIINIEVKNSGLRVLTLPSGRQLFYHQVKTDGKNYKYVNRHSQPEALWKGVLMENVAQGINQDVSDWYKGKAHKQIAPVVMHCYDEFTMEVDESKAETVLEQLKQFTKCSKPDWAEGLPLDFSYWCEKRYGK